MSEQPAERKQGVVRSVVCLAWAAAVCGAFVRVYLGALGAYVGKAAGRFPFLERIIEWLDSAM